MPVLFRLFLVSLSLSFHLYILQCNILNQRYFLRLISSYFIYTSLLSIPFGYSFYNYVLNKFTNLLHTVLFIFIRQMFYFRYYLFYKQIEAPLVTFIFYLPFMFIFFFKITFLKPTIYNIYLKSFLCDSSILFLCLLYLLIFPLLMSYIFLILDMCLVIFIRYYLQDL